MSNNKVVEMTKPTLAEKALQSAGQIVEGMLFVMFLDGSALTKKNGVMVIATAEEIAQHQAEVAQDEADAAK